MSEFKEYKVNDKVIVRKNKTLCLPNFDYMAVHTIVHVVDIPLGQRVRLDSFPEDSYVSSEAIDFATPDEIAAGHRIESSNGQAISDCSLSKNQENEKQSDLSIKQERQIEDIGDDRDMSQHISPNCKAKDV